MTAASARTANRLFWGYCALTAATVVGAAVGSVPLAAGCWIMVWILGAVALPVGILRLRPERAGAWWLIEASQVVAVAASLLTISVAPWWRAPELAGLAAAGGWPWLLADLPLALALVLLGRTPVDRSGVADVLDAALSACGLFLILWVLVVAPARVNPSDVPGGVVTDHVIYPIGTLVVLALTAKLLFTWGPRSVSWILLVLAVACSLAGITATLVASLTGGEFASTRVVALLLVGFPALVGAAGLHPSLAARPSPAAASADLSWRRMLWFALLAVMGPVAWLVDVMLTQRAGDEADFILPGLLSSLLALLLVARLVLVAGVARSRGDRLSQQAGALASTVREQQELERQLSYRALHDPLTGLTNRVVLDERLEWSLSRRDSTAQALILLDLDEFKDINDRFGHLVGDDVLIGATRRLREATPSEATLARLGGDEFGVFLEQTDQTSARRVAEEIRSELGRPYPVGGSEVASTASVGLYVIGPDDRGVTPLTVLRDADLALHAAKTGGGDRVVAFQPQLRTEQLDHVRLSTGLRRALARDEFSLEFQPIMNLATGKALAVEALLRWTAPEGRRVSPAQFVPIAEDIGLIGPIGEWVLRHACARARGWYLRHGVLLAVNVSGRQLDDPHFADQVSEVLASNDLPAAALILELTETSLISISATATAVGQLSRIRDQGIRVAVDDFGTGYSSLSYISRLPVDIIKLDRTFMAVESQEDEGNTNQPFINAILELVRSLGLMTIVEGVETQGQAELLRRLGCRFGQGLFLSRPAPPAVIDRALAENLAPRDGSSSPPAP